MSIVVVSATRASEQEFPRTPIGRTIATYVEPVRLKQRVFYESRRSLSACYNEAIDDAAPEDILVFVHDDVLIVDFFWTVRVRRAFALFDVLGIAGNRRRLPRQPGWAIVDENDTRDADEHLSGVLGHGSELPCAVTVFGAVPAACKLLDGALLAVRKQTLMDHRLRFDERFDFDFYDMDFCRQAEASGLRMGTIPVSILHRSEGAYFTPSWKANYQRYLDKWGE